MISKGNSNMSDAWTIAESQSGSSAKKSEKLFKKNFFFFWFFFLKRKIFFVEIFLKNFYTLVLAGELRPRPSFQPCNSSSSSSADGERITSYLSFHRNTTRLSSCVAKFSIHLPVTGPVGNTAHGAAITWLMIQTTVYQSASCAHRAMALAASSSHPKVSFLYLHKKFKGDVNAA